MSGRERERDSGLFGGRRGRWGGEEWGGGEEGGGGGGGGETTYCAAG